jgi:oxygen-independent coproporphyrinogen-3 oxidase
VAKLTSGSSPEVMRETIDASSEFIFLGLRLNRGVDLDGFRERFNIDLPRAYRAEIADLTEKGLVGVDGGRLFLTAKGMLFSNEVFAAFV